MQSFLKKLLEIREINKNNIEQAINELKPPIFWKDKQIFILQAKKWNKQKIVTLLKKTYNLEINLKSSYPTNNSVLIKKLERALKNPKNFNEPERVDYSVPKRLGSVLFPKYRQAVNAYKQFDKFNNKKVSDVFRDTKGKRIGNRLIGDFGGFNLLQDVSKLLNNEGGFQLQQSLKDSIRDMDYLTNKRNQKRAVVGANK